MSGPRFLYCVSGEGHVMRQILTRWAAHGMPGHIAGVLADRPCPALQWAAANGYETRLVAAAAFSERAAFDAEITEAFAHFGPDYALLNYNHLLPPTVTKNYASRILNLHYALLPSFPGFGACANALKRGVRIAGVTVHFADATTDGGPIVAQAALNITAADTPTTLGRRMFPLAVPLLMQCARWLGEQRLTVNGQKVTVRDARYLTAPFVPALDEDLAALASALQEKP